MNEFWEYWRSGGPLLAPLALICFGIWYTTLVLARDLHSKRPAAASEQPALRRRLFWLRALVAVAPLLGLLGTVKGMIVTFHVLSLRGTAQPELLSGGIAEALVTTQAGLVVALPGLIAAHALARQLAARERLEGG